MKWRYARNSHPEASILFSTESERHRLTEKAWTVWRPVLRLKLKIPCLWLTRWNRSSCVYRLHPVCRGYKSGNRCIHGYRCLYRRADGKSNLSARSKIRYSRSSCFSEMKKKNLQVCVSQNSAPMSWRIGIERFGGTHLKFLGMHLVQNWIRERKRQSGAIFPKGELHQRNPCPPSSEEQPPEETSRQADCTSKVTWNLARKYAS